MPVVPAAIVCACTVPSISSRNNFDKAESQIKAACQALTEADEHLKRVSECYDNIEKSFNEIRKDLDELEETRRKSKEKLKGVL